jgi:NAD(P)-dependent dehydrogenase (short-subunit alcohol dehydrogenase family)
MSATDKVVLVTGASRGIAGAAARLFAAAGNRVAVHYRQDADPAAQTLASLPGDGHCSMAADVSDPQAVASLVDEVTTRIGGRDALVNNAGIEEHHVVAKIEYTRWQAAWQRILGTQAPDFPTGCIVDVNGACYLRS